MVVFNGFVWIFIHINLIFKSRHSSDVGFPSCNPEAAGQRSESSFCVWRCVFLKNDKVPTFVGVHRFILQKNHFQMILRVQDLEACQKLRKNRGQVLFTQKARRPPGETCSSSQKRHRDRRVACDQWKRPFNNKKNDSQRLAMNFQNTFCKVGASSQDARQRVCAQEKNDQTVMKSSNLHTQ